MVEPTDADRARDLPALLEGHREAVAAMAARGLPVPPEAEALAGLLRRCIAAEAEVARLRAILDAPRTALFADGREPTTNERHLLNLLDWRHREADELRAEIARLQRIIDGLADRAAAQSALLARLAEKGGS